MSNEHTESQGLENENVGTAPSEVVETQSQETTTDSGSGGQGFLEPYLRDLPEDQRPLVEPVLEKYRKEQDAEVTRRFEQLKEETRIPTMIHNALMDDPVYTLNWFADRMLEERGIDIRSELKSQWYDGQESTEELTSTENSQEPQALTQDDVERLLEQREQERINQERQQQYETQQQQQQEQQINSWLNESAKNMGFDFDDSNGTDPLRPVIIMQANQLHESGVAKGKAAIEMATESVFKRLGKGSGQPNRGSNSGTQPTVATGGTSPPPPNFNVQDSKQRKARMLELLTPPQE